MPPTDPRLQSFARELRKEMTKEERHLWYDFLRLQPVRFLRQKPIGRYIVDFYCAQAKLVIELDGSQHFEEDALKKDEQRTRFLQTQGITVIRFTNRQISEQFPEVCQTINAVLQGKSDYRR